VQVSRVAAGHPNGLALEIFGDQGAAKWEQERPAEFQLMLNEGSAGTRGYRRVIIGPDHPYVAGGLPMDAPGVGLGQNDGFAYQARAFLEEVAGIDEADSLPRCASFDEGVHNMEVLAAVAESAARGGSSVAVATQRAMASQGEAVA
jgi:predicted dehydrogenase